jgi:MYXO-CTERM domain-containing protein
VTDKLTLGGLGIVFLLGCAEERREWSAEAGGVRARLDEAGLRLSADTADIHLPLIGVSRPEQAVSLAPPRFASDQAGASLERGSGVTEWAKLKRGTLEHGVTLDSPPPGQGPITVTVRVEGARPEVDADGRGADLVVPSGVVRYGQLAVIDADGHVLPSRMSVRGSDLSVELDDAGAAYPVVIDPTIWAQQEPLTGLGTFGESVAVSNGLILVSSTTEDSGQGAVHVFAPSEGSFTEVAKLAPEANETSAFYGSAIAAADGVLAVAGDDADAKSSNLDVFELQGQTWTKISHLPAIGLVEEIATDGTTIIVGLGDDQALVIEKNAGVWEQTQVLAGPAISQFGEAVAVDGDWALVGAPGDTDAQGTEIGSVWAYHRVSTGWELSQVLTAGEPITFGNFGESLGIDGTRAVVGSIITTHGLNEGSAYVVELVGETWTETAHLFRPDPEAFTDRFGAAVALTDGHVLVGSPDTNSPLTLAGALHIYSSESSWANIQSLPGLSRTGRFGRAISVEDRLAAIATQVGAVFPLVLVGQPCESGDECATGYCVDGHCCNTSCEGQCEACDVGAIAGICSPIFGSPHADHPPCDASCVDGIATPAGTCNGGDVCTVPAAIVCAPFACDQTECRDSCLDSTDCAPGYACEPMTGACVADAPVCDGDHTLSRPDGSVESCAPYRCSNEGACFSRCTQNGDCVSGFVCRSTGECTALAEDAADGCTVDASSPRRAPHLAVGLLVLGWAFSRRRQKRNG